MNRKDTLKILRSAIDRHIKSKPQNNIGTFLSPEQIKHISTKALISTTEMIGDKEIFDEKYCVYEYFGESIHWLIFYIFDVMDEMEWEVVPPKLKIYYENLENEVVID